MSDMANKLIDTSKRSVKLADEVLFFVRIALQTDINMKNLTRRLISLYDLLIPSEHVLISDLPQNNYEFLDTLKTIIARIMQHSDFTERTKLEFIDARIDTLIEELTSTLFPQHRDYKHQQTKRNTRTKQTKREQNPVSEALIACLPFSTVSTEYPSLSRIEERVFLASASSSTTRMF